MHDVFVYGTLERGFPNYRAGMAGQRFIGCYRTRERYPLIIGGRWFSPLQIAEPGEGHRVLGEVFEVDETTLAMPDRLESTHLPTGYERHRIEVETEESAMVGSRIDVWCYLKPRARIDIVHSEPMDAYPLDPRYIPADKRSG